MTFAKLSSFLLGLVLVFTMSYGCAAPTSPTAGAAAGGPGTSLEPGETTLEIDIDVAPNVLNLLNQGQVVTVHTNLPFGEVVASTVLLNDVPIDSWKADNRGQFVAKFLIEAVKGLDLAIGNYNTLKIEGVTTSGTKFWGTQDILVVNNVPRK